jgi:ATP-binding cassette, subfamily B, multidrug efflux pump
MKKNKTYDIKTLGRVVKLAWNHKKLFVASIVLAILLAPVSTISPYIVKIMVDDYIVNVNLDGLFKMAFLFAGVIILNVVMRYFFIYTISDLGQSVIKDLRTRTYEHILGLKLKHFDQTPVGTNTTRTINDIQAINEVFTQGVITIVADFLAVITVIILMFYTSWMLTLICLATLPLLMLATYIFKEKVRVSYSKVRLNLSNMNAFLQERITGMRIVQIFNAEKQEMEKFKKINRDYTQANLDSVLYYSVFFPAVELISALALAMMVWFGAKAFLQDFVSFGALVAFPLYLNLMFRPVRMMADKFNTLQMGLVAAERVYYILDKDEVIPNKGSVVKERLQGKIQFENVWFAYDDENYVLKDINFSIPAGKTLAVIGSTGSGKTTIINILNRFYDIQKGDIILDDIPINEYELLALRKRIAIVLQDVFLFHGSLYENISLKDPSISLDQVIEASKSIGADKFFDLLPNGYNFQIMERGSNLSVGQRQLVSFVRALVFNPDILILDEATSSIDTETEAVIQFAIEKMTYKRSSLIIAHRLSTIRHADYIMVMDHGRIIEFGNHTDLLTLPGGRYKELYDLQFEGVI